MTKIRLLVLIVASLATVGSTAVQADAQQTYRPLKQVNRWLGHWHNHGYHYRNPGPDVSYYNPYSAHNSRLIGQHYQSSLGNQAYQNGMGYGFGNGYANGYDTNVYGQNVYGQNNYSSQYNSKPTPTRKDQEPEDSYDDEADDYARPVESRIEGEVESMDDVGDSLSPGNEGATFEPSQSSPSDTEIIPSSSPSNRTPDPYWDNQTSSRVPLNGPIRN